MKKYFFLAIIAFLLHASVKAAVGDTTWVQANNCQLSYYNNYDTVVTFPAPGTIYRKIYMIFSLGKYMCPAGSTYCGDWDYTVLNYLMTPAGDTLELSRLITPYANAAAPRTPWSWVQNYVYDVTDYAPLLHDTAAMRILFSGYSGGFTANIKFAFIEGTPERDVVAIKRRWYGSYTYGDTTHLDSFDINTHFPAITDTVPAGTVTTALKFLVTGHGSDNNECCEFMSHNYNVLVNGSTVATHTIWRDDCGSNELYPQSGTWLFERANWCPGALVHPVYHVLPGLTAGSPYSLDIQFEPYIGQPSSTGGRGSYTTEASIFYYKGMNKMLDASLDDIIAPTSDLNHFRENPTNMSPTVHVKNTGATTITSINFQYGVQGYAAQTYTWSGSLASLAESDISLPLLSELDSLSGVSGTHTFTCTMLSVNGSADDDGSNNMMSSSFVTAPVWPSPFKVTMKTNNEGANENRWVITDMNNNVVRTRSGSVNSTIYRDTVNLPRGCYKLQVFDSSCDGLNWWVFPQFSPPISSGYITVSPLTGAALALHGDVASGTYNNDFGCGFVQYFFLDSMATMLGISNVNEHWVVMDVYPNPAKHLVNVDISGLPNVEGRIEILDMMGRVVLNVACNETHKQVGVSALASGLYTVVFVNGTTGGKLLTKLVITN